MAENEVPIKITIEGDEAEKVLKSLQKNTEKAVGGMESAFASLKTVAIGALAFFAGKAIIGGLEDIVAEASKADQVVRDLGLALSATGDFSDDAVKSFEEFASALQKTTTFTDEAILQSATLAKGFGLTNDRAKQLTQAATSLSVAMGVDLQTATEQLGATLAGTGGKLSKRIPEFRQLTEEQFKNGAAIDVLISKYGDLAAASAKTFGGAVTQAKNSFGEIFESIGKIITQNPVIVASIQLLAKVFQQIGKTIDDNRATITEYLSTAIKGLLNVIPTLVNYFQILKSAVQAIDFATLAKGILLFGAALGIVLAGLNAGAIISFIVSIGGLATAFTGLAAAAGAAAVSLAATVAPFLAIAAATAAVAFGIDFLQAKIRGTSTVTSQITDSISNFASKFGDALKSNGASLNGFTNGQDDAKKKSNDLFGTILGGIGKIDKLNGSLAAATDGLKNGAKGAADLADNLKLLEPVKGSFDKLKTSVVDLQKEIDKETLSAVDLADAEQRRGEEALASAALELALTGKVTEENLKLLDTFDQLIKKKSELAKGKISILDTTVGNIKDIFAGGLSGAFNLAIGNLTSSLKKLTIGDIASGLGNALKGAFEFGANLLNGTFVQGGFQFAQTFAELPGQIIGIFKNFDKVFSELAAALPEIINKLIDDLPAIGQAIADSIGKALGDVIARLPEILQAIINALLPLIEKVFGELIPQLIRQLPAIIKVLVKGIVSVIDIILRSLPEIITAIFDALPEIVRVIADAIPDLIVSILNNLPAIIQSVITGLLTAIPEIAVQLAESFSDPNNIAKITIALVKAAPAIGVAIFKGFFNGYKAGFFAIGTGIANVFKNAVTGLGTLWSSEFIQGIGPFFSTLFSQIGTFFAPVAIILQTAFTSGGTYIYNSIINAFTSVYASLYGVIINAFTIVYAGLTGVFASGGELLKGGLVSGAQEIFQKIADGGQAVVDKVSAPFQKLIDAIEKLTGADLGSVTGGGGGGLGGLAKKIGFATGGTVPQGFPGDTFPAALSSGEMIIPANDVSRLSAFLDQQAAGGGGGADNTLLVALLTQISQKLDNPMTTIATAEVDGRAFANIMLELSRNNARTAA